MEAVNPQVGAVAHPEEVAQRKENQQRRRDHTRPSWTTVRLPLKAQPTPILGKEKTTSELIQMKASTLTTIKTSGSALSSQPISTTKSTSSSSRKSSTTAALKESSLVSLLSTSKTANGSSGTMVKSSRLDSYLATVLRLRDKSFSALHSSHLRLDSTFQRVSNPMASLLKVDTSGSLRDQRRLLRRLSIPKMKTTKKEEKPPLVVEEVLQVETRLSLAEIPPQLLPMKAASPLPQEDPMAG